MILIKKRISRILKQVANMAKRIKNFDLKKKLTEDAIIIYNNVRPHLSNHILIPMHALNKLKRKQYKSKKLNNHMTVQL